MKTTFTYFILLLLFAGCSSQVSETENTNQIESLRTELAKEKAELDSLKSKFVFETDEFSEDGWYFHKQWGRGFLQRNTLSATVGEYGTMYLTSNFYGKKWINHEAIQVKIGNAVTSSETVPLNDQHNIHEIAEGHAYEVVNYTRERDNGIISAIASIDKDVLIRLKGPQRSADFTLDAQDRKAIAECRRLAELIRTLPDKESQLKRAELGL